MPAKQASEGKGHHGRVLGKPDNQLLQQRNGEEMAKFARYIDIGR